MKKFYYTTIMCLLSYACLAIAEPDTTKPSIPYSEAQTLLFDTPHLKNIVSEAKLYYDVAQTGSMTTKLTDRIVLSVTPVDGHEGKDIEPQFLSGKNKKEFPPVRKRRGNFLLAYFLQWDIEKLQNNRALNMGRIHRQYVQSVMRDAFLTQAEVKAGDISFNGKSLEAEFIRMQPLLGMKDEPRYENLWNKRYEFVLADVPGGIYRITTETPGDKPGAPKELTEITLSHIEPAGAYRPPR